jgi:hypothetical protein
VGRRQEDRRQGVAERDLGYVGEQTEGADRQDRQVEPRDRQTVEARSDRLRRVLGVILHSSTGGDRASGCLRHQGGSVLARLLIVAGNGA